MCHCEGLRAFLSFVRYGRGMSERASLLAQRFVPLLRMALIGTCAMALIFAGQPLPL